MLTAIMLPDIAPIYLFSPLIAFYDLNYCTSVHLITSSESQCLTFFFQFAIAINYF